MAIKIWLYNGIQPENLSDNKHRSDINRHHFTMGSIEVSSSLFQPLKLGAVTLSHRVVHAPCTRMRASKESDGVYVPNDLNVEYYSQRASQGGLLLTEATPISRIVCIDSSKLRLFYSADFKGRWIPRCSRNLHSLTNRWMEEGNRCCPLQRRLHILSALARWPSNCPIFHWRKGSSWCK